MNDGLRQERSALNMKSGLNGRLRAIRCLFDEFDSGSTQALENLIPSVSQDIRYPYAQRVVVRRKSTHQRETAVPSGYRRLTEFGRVAVANFEQAKLGRVMPKDKTPAAHLLDIRLTHDADLDMATNAGEIQS